MEKVYRLLRNNQQTGPHTLDELLQLGLKPYDLIWVEGRSAGWQYPSEVPTLKQYAPQPQPEPKKETKKIEEPNTEEQKKKPLRRIFVSKPTSSSAPSAPSSEPSYSIEEKAEALRQRIANYTPSSSGNDLQTRYQKEVDDIGVDYGAWLYEKRKKKKNYGKMIVLPLVLTAAAFAAYKYWPASDSPLTVLPSAMVAAPQKEQENTSLSSEESSAAIDSTYVLDTARAYPETRNSFAVPGSKKATLGKTSPDTVQEILQEETPEPVVTEPVIVQKEDKPEVQVAEPEKKKKGIKGFFGKLFGKKKDKKEEVVEPSIVDITGQVELKNSRSSTGGFMMGVQNQKLTLSNRSSTKLVKATVEVSYYSENNSLLEKRTIVFQEISPRSSGTLPVPDHRTADHAVFKIVSATGLGSTQR